MAAVYNCLNAYCTLSVGQKGQTAVLWWGIVDYEWQITGNWTKAVRRTHTCTSREAVCQYIHTHIVHVCVEGLRL